MDLKTLLEEFSANMGWDSNQSTQEKLDRLIEENRASQSPRIDLSNLHLNRFPTALYELPHLEEIILSKDEEWKENNKESKRVARFGSMVKGEVEAERMMSGFNMMSQFTARDAVQAIQSAFSIEEDLAPHFPKLRLLDLRGNMVADSPDIFGLFLDWDSYWQLRSDDKISPKNVVGIRLTKFDSEGLGEGALGELTALRYLDLSRLGLRMLPGWITGPLPNLEHIELQHNRFETFPVTIDHLAQLRSIDIGYNNLIEIPLNINEQFPKLQTLRLGFNRLKSLPDNLAQLPLQELDLSGNPWAAFPTIFTKIPTLRSLKCSNPDSKLEHLKEAERFKLTQLPDSIGDCVQLEAVDFSGNALKSLPTSFAQLKKMVVLKM